MKQGIDHIRPVRGKMKNVAARKKTPEEQVLPYRPEKANHIFGLFFFLFSWALYGNTITRHTPADSFLIPGKQIMQPLVNLIFSIEQYLWGMNTIFCHLFNVMIYAFLSMLVFFTLKRLLKDYNILFPFLIALVFMVHPVHTEVVANLNYRGELLASFCGISSLWFLLNYLERKKNGFLVFASLIFICGYLCNSSVLTFLLLYFLVFYFFTGLPAKKYLPLMLIILVAAYTIHYFLQFVYFPPTRMTGYTDNPLFVEKGLQVRFNSGWSTLLFYLRILSYPVPLLYYYGYNEIPVINPSFFRVVLSMSLFFIFLTIAILKFRKREFISFSIFWFFLAILPYSNVFFPVSGIVGERYVFTASLGFCMALVAFIFFFFQANPRSLTLEIDARLKILAVIILFLIPYATLTVKRNHDWRNLDNLYSHDIRHLEKSVQANIDISTYYLNRSDTVKGIRYLEKAAALWPDPVRYMKLSDLLNHRGEKQRADYYRRLGENK
ncbi:MAG: hypothetical protein M0P58_02585 [Bacteroidales bacterium]|nr:hypothetical protein [Bacteroidales bacterium]